METGTWRGELSVSSERHVWPIVSPYFKGNEAKDSAKVGDGVTLNLGCDCPVARRGAQGNEADIYTPLGSSMIKYSILIRFGPWKICIIMPVALSPKTQFSLKR